MRILVFSHEHFASVRIHKEIQKLKKFVCTENELEGALFFVMPCIIFFPGKKKKHCPLRTCVRFRPGRQRSLSLPLPPSGLRPQREENSANFDEQGLRAKNKNRKKPIISIAFLFVIMFCWQTKIRVRWLPPSLSSARAKRGVLLLCLFR
jgi:hypothetical protein